jgi:hypothetical protein
MNVLPNCPVAVLARAHSLLSAQDVSPALCQTIRGIVRSASYEAPRCPEGVAFLFLCVAIEATQLHDADDVDEALASHAAIQRMLNTLEATCRFDGRVEAVISEAA